MSDTKELYWLICSLYKTLMSYICTNLCKRKYEYISSVHLATAGSSHSSASFFLLQSCPEPPRLSTTVGAPNIQKSPFVFFRLTCFQPGRLLYSSLLISSAFCGSKHIVTLWTSLSSPTSCHVLGQRAASGPSSSAACKRWVQTHAWCQLSRESTAGNKKLDGNKQFRIDEAWLKLTDVQQDSPPP